MHQAMRATEGDLYRMEVYHTNDNLKGLNSSIADFAKKAVIQIWHGVEI